MSVDPPEDAARMRDALRLSFPLLSDPELKLIRGVGIENPEVDELSLHAVYIVEPTGKVVYRKVARRRPDADELLEAVDFHFGTDPEP